MDKSKKQEAILGFGIAPSHPKESVNITVSAQAAFHPDRLIITHLSENLMSDKKNKQYILGFGITTLRPKESANISVTSQDAFHPDRLIIASDVASDVLVNALSIDGLNQLASVGSIPGDTFRASIGLEISMARVKQGGLVVLSVTNKSTHNIHVSASLSGELL